jgi:hypothetical protein
LRRADALKYEDFSTFEFFSTDSDVAEFRHMPNGEHSISLVDALSLAAGQKGVEKERAHIKKLMPIQPALSRTQTINKKLSESAVWWIEEKRRNELTPTYATAHLYIHLGRVAKRVLFPYLSAITTCLARDALPH